MQGLVQESLLPADLLVSVEPAPQDDSDDVGPLIRIEPKLWRSWLTDPEVVARYQEKVYQRGKDECWPYTGAISSTGHASFRAASLPGRTRRGTVPGHMFGYQLVHGVIPRLGWPGVPELCLCHRCDWSSCQNDRHMRLGTAGENNTEWAARRSDPISPLADVRGAAGRARAIAQTIREGLAAGEDAAAIEHRIAVAIDEGRPLTLW